MKKLFAGVAAVMLAATCATPALAESVSVKTIAANNSQVALINGDYVALGLGEGCNKVLHENSLSSMANLTYGTANLFAGVANEDMIMRDAADNTIAFNLKTTNSATFNGRTDLKAGVMAENDIEFNGELVNSDNEQNVVYSVNGDVYFNTGNTNLKGFVFAPNGTVHFNGQWNNLNGTVIIAKDVVFNDNTINVNPSEFWNAQIATFLR